MLKLENQILHHKRQLRQWKATSQRSFGVNDGWFNRATRQVKFHTAEIRKLMDELGEHMYQHGGDIQPWD